MRKVRNDCEVTVHVHASMHVFRTRTGVHVAHMLTIRARTRLLAAYYIPPLHVLGSRSIRDSGGVILKNKPWGLVMPTLTY